MTKDDEIRRADQAKAILEHDLVREAFAVIETAIVEEWRAAPARDAEGRERLWLMLKMLDKFRGHLTGLVENGKIVKARIAEIEKERKINLWPRRTA